MKKLLTFAAAGEMATGVALVVSPPLVARLLLGADAADLAAVIGRVTGIGLIGLGVACWPSGVAQPLCGMLTYSALATVYLAYLGVRGEWVGPLLWPAVVLHAVLTLLLARIWIKSQRTGQSTTDAKG